MLMIDGSLMGSCKPPLEKRCNSVDKLKVFCGSFMPIFGGSYIRVSGPSIAPYPTPQFNIFLKKRPNAVSRSISDNASPYSAKTFGSLVFNCNNHYCLPFCSTPNRAFLPLSSNIGLINFHQSRKPLPILKHHCSPKLMQDTPSRLVTSKTENPLKSFCTASVLLPNQPPCSSEPYLKLYSRILIYGSCLDRCLMMAGNAHKKTVHHLPIFALATFRTLKSFCPSYGRQILYTGRFRAKFLFKFQYCFGVVFHIDTLPLVLL